MKRWFKYVKPYLPYFILGPLGMIVEVIGEMLMPQLLGLLIDGANENTLTVPGSLGISAALLGVVLLMMTGGVAGAYFGAKASVNFAADLRRDVYSKIQKYSFANIDKFSAGSLVTRMTNDVTQLQNFVNMLLRMALRSQSKVLPKVPFHPYSAYLKAPQPSQSYRFPSPCCRLQKPDLLP